MRVVLGWSRYGRWPNYDSSAWLYTPSSLEPRAFRSLSHSLRFLFSSASSSFLLSYTHTTRAYSMFELE